MDDADIASVPVELEREAGIQRVVNRNTEKPLVVKGVRLCLTCFDPIPKNRIDAEKDAVRCIDCQEEYEQYQKRVSADG